MSDDLDLVKRLQGRARFCRDRGEIKSPVLMEDAARALVAKDAENARLREAMRFYADFYENPNDGPWGVNSQDFGKLARAALKIQHKGEVP